MNQTPGFTLIRSRRRSLSIEVTHQAQVIVRAPLHAQEDYIIKFTHSKSGWIEKQIAKMQKYKTRKYAEGEEFLYLGNPYKLHIGNYKQIHIADTLNFPNFLEFRIKEELSKWYINQAKDLIKERVKHHSTIMQTQYKDIAFSDTKSKWGSCAPDNALQFNWRLIMSPLLVIDYVVVHELTHTQEKNHSRIFWKKVEQYKPAYKQYKKWLEENSRKMFL